MGEQLNKPETQTDAQANEQQGEQTDSGIIESTIKCSTELLTGENERTNEKSELTNLRKQISS